VVGNLHITNMNPKKCKNDNYEGITKNNHEYMVTGHPQMDEINP
jgi:hypothetical protein